MSTQNHGKESHPALSIVGFPAWKNFMTLELVHRHPHNHLQPISGALQTASSGTAPCKNAPGWLLSGAAAAVVAAARLDSPCEG